MPLCILLLTYGVRQKIVFQVAAFMKFIANKINNSYLMELLPRGDVEIDGVMAAIAYGKSFPNENDDFISNCLKNKRRLDIWMRYDHTVPVAPSLLRRLLNNYSKNIFCRLIPDMLHSKVIWWKGYGAYIGSANLTDRAWNNNIEAGLFFSSDDLDSTGMVLELENFFESLQSLESSFPLTNEIIAEMERLELLRREANDMGKKDRSVGEWRGLNFTPNNKIVDKQKERFQKEWNETLTVLRDIGSQLREYRPSWVSLSVPEGWQADQFLHAFYYTQVREGLEIPYEDFYLANKNNPQQALKKAMEWWKSLESPPNKEDSTLYESAPYIQKHLSKENIYDLTLEEITNICRYTHATHDHISKIEIPFFGITETKTVKIPERVPIFASWLAQQRNKKGWDIKELWYYVLYGGNEANTWERLYIAGRTSDCKFSRYGLNSLAELVGWARPDIAPPRNGRTSKALRALGFDVKIY